MPRYHFNLVDTTEVSDQGGHVYEFERDAIVAAKKLADELFAIRPELRNLGYKVVLLNAEGSEVYVAPLDRVRALSSSPRA